MKFWLIFTAIVELVDACKSLVVLSTIDKFHKTLTTKVAFTVINIAMLATFKIALITYGSIFMFKSEAKECKNISEDAATMYYLALSSLIIGYIQMVICCAPYSYILIRKSIILYYWRKF